MSDDKQAEYQARSDKFIGGLAASRRGRDLLSGSLEKNGLAMMQILSADVFPQVSDPSRVENALKGILLDTETTGVNTETDEITELGMVEFFYDKQGIVSLGRTYEEFNEPLNKTIDAEVQALTGITNEMVKGKRIDPDEVRDFCADASICVAHNANFDRKILESRLPGCGFDEADWFCTVQDIEWILRGKSGKSLPVLAVEAGYVYGSHRATADCIATAFVVGDTGKDGSMPTAFAEMLQNGARDTIHIVAKDSDFHAKDKLKERGYMFSGDGVENYGFKKTWWRAIPEDPEAIAAEAAFLRDEIYGKDVSIPSYRIDASTRYSARKPGKMVPFQTREAANLVEAADQLDLENQSGTQATMGF